MEIALIRHHGKEKRFGPSPDNNYTSGYGSQRRRGGFFGRFGRKRKGDLVDDGNALPEHTLPGQLAGDRHSYGTESTAVAHDKPIAGAGRGPSNDYVKPETGYGYGHQQGGYKQGGYQQGGYQQAGIADSNNSGFVQQPAHGGGGGDGWQHTPQVAEAPGNYRYSDGVYDRA